MTDHVAIRYDDKKFRIILAIIAGHLFTAYGEKASVLELFLMPAYWIAFIVSFLIALGVISYVYWANTYLNKKLDWLLSPLPRALAQLGLALVVPSVMAFLLAAGYLRVRGVNILKTDYPTHEFQYVVMMLSLLNAYYIGYYFFLRLKQAHAKLNNQAEPLDIEPHFIVSNGKKNLPLAFDSIIFIIREDDANIIHTREERYFYGGTMDDAISKLPNRDFFRVNRQLIINRAILKSYSNATFGKIILELNAQLPEEAVVSQKRAKAFRDWVS